MKSTLGKLLGVAGLMAVMGAAPETRADTLPAIGGHAWFANEAACFFSSLSGMQTGWAGVRNSCSGTKKFLVPAPASWTGSTTYRATSTLQPGLIGVPPSCAAIVNTASNGFVNATQMLPVFNNQTTLGTISLPSGGTHHFDCDFPDGVSNGLRLTQVRWTQN